MDTCVRNGMFDEALDLLDHSRMLRAQHPDSAILGTGAIGGEVDRLAEAMLADLKRKLCSNVQLPVCLKLISHMRRLGFHTEPTLRVQFLQCRQSWLETLIRKLPDPKVDSYTYLVRYSDIVRVHVFDIVTQYRAIFRDDTSMQDTAAGGGCNSDHGLLHAWVTHASDSFLGKLRCVLYCSPPSTVCPPSDYVVVFALNCLPSAVCPQPNTDSFLGANSGHTWPA